MPSVCNEPVTGSHALGSSHRLGRCCLGWTSLPSHGIGSTSVSLILLLLLMVDSDDLNEVTLLFQPTCIQLYSIANTIRAYSGILHGVRTLMAEENSPVLTCIKMIGASVCYVSVLLFLQQFVGSRCSLSLRLLLTFSCSFLTREGTSPALIPPTPVDLGTGSRRLLVSDTNRLKSRFIRLGRMSVCVGKCRRIRSQLRKSDARHVMYKPTEPTHLRFQRKRRRRSCCPVLLCSSPPTRDVRAVTFSPHMKMSYCSSGDVVLRIAASP